jgi:hypothetical protein
MEMIKQDSKSKNFNVKANMLGLSIDDRIDKLNKIYNGKMTFDKEYDIPAFMQEAECGITIKDFDKSLVCIELPEEENLLMSGLFRSYDFGSLVTIKLPKCVKSIDIDRCRWIHNIKRLFLWDTTEIISRHSEGALQNILGTHSKLEMIIIQSTSGGKSKIYRTK